MFDYSPTVACNISMSRSEVVTILMRELALLRRELWGRDQHITDSMRQLTEEIKERRQSDDPDPSHLGLRLRAQLTVVDTINIFNQEWHGDLRPATESEVSDV